LQPTRLLTDFRSLLSRKGGGDGEFTMKREETADWRRAKRGEKAKGPPFGPEGTSSEKGEHYSERGRKKGDKGVGGAHGREEG